MGGMPVRCVTEFTWFLIFKFIFLSCIIFPFFVLALLCNLFLALKSDLPVWCFFSVFSVVYILFNHFDCFLQFEFFLFHYFVQSFVSVIAVINFEISKSSAFILSNAHSFSISINLRQKSSGVSDSVCLVQNKSPRL